MSRVDSAAPTPDPLLGTRLRDVPAAERSSASVATLLAHASFDPTPKVAQPWARIEENLLARLRPTPKLRWLWPSIAMASMVVATAAVAGPTLVRWVQRTQQVQLQHVEVKPAAAVPTAVTTKRVQGVESALPPSPIVKPLQEPSRPTKLAVHAIKTTARTLAMAPPVKDVPPLPSALAEESKLLGTALASLRKEKDATRTLALLDDYQSKFPQGELAGEAQRTRVEAFLLQRRMPEALAVLDQMSFETRARDSEWRVLRGELRASAHRCAQAQADFSLALKVNDKGLIAERALYGRASCLLELKDAAGAHTALLDYASRFPSGAHAVQVRKVLEASAP